MADYSRVVGGNLQFAGYDQGIDFTGQGSVLAADSGVITRIQRGTFSFIQGTGSIIVYRIPDGRYIYVMEAINIDPSLSVGDHVQPGQVLGSVNSSYPGIEMGWASVTGSPMAPLGTSNYGRDFADYVTGGSATTPLPVTEGGGSTPAPAPAPSDGGGVTRPDTSGSGNQNIGLFGVPGPGRIWHDTTGFFGDVGGWIANPFEDIYDAVKKGILAFVRFISFFINPLNWLRMVEFVIGAALIFWGVILFISGSKSNASSGGSWSNVLNVGNDFIRDSKGGSKVTKVAKTAAKSPIK